MRGPPGGTPGGDCGAPGGDCSMPDGTPGGTPGGRGLYTAMRPVRRRKGEKLWYPCGRCGVARVKGETCSREVCVVDAEEEERRGLEGLPQGVLERVCGELGYRDLVSLRKVSHGLRERVDAVGMCRDVYSMWSFVMERTRAWRRRDKEHRYRWCSRRWGWCGPRACFGCFRPRTRDQFSCAQFRLKEHWMKGDYWRGRCWECLRRFYHPQLADAEARARFDRQIMCGVCNGMMYKDEDCLGCFARRDEYAEWARLRRAKMATRRGPDLLEEPEGFVPVACLEGLWLGDDDSRGEEATGSGPLGDA